MTHQPFYFDDNFKNIGIKLSGGADSAVIYYAVCDYYKDKPDIKIYPMTMYTDLKSWYPVGAKKIIEKVSELTGVVPVEHYITYAPGHVSNKDAEPYNTGQEEMTNTAIEKFSLDVVYSGLTKNPPVEKMISFFKEKHTEFNLDLERLLEYIDTRDQGRDIDTDPLESVFVQHRFTKPVRRVRPFINSDKKSTYDAYLHYKVLDTLYPITYSCEIPPKVPNTTEFEHCGHCFFCLERWYGFGRII